MSEAQSPAISKNIYQRMLEVQKKVVSVNKTKTVQMTGERNYRSVTHDEVAGALHVSLAEEGIVLLPDVIESTTSDFIVKKKNNYGEYEQRWYRTDIKVKVKWINADKPDDFFESHGSAFALDTSDKSYAKAYSLALKIVLLKVHLLESRDDEENRDFENQTNGENQNDQSRGASGATNQRPKGAGSASPKSNSKPTTKPAAKAKDGASAPANNDDAGKPSGSTAQSEATAKKKPDGPGDYVVKIGDDTTKDKKLIEIGETTQRKLFKWTQEQMKAAPPPRNISTIMETNRMIKEFFESTGVSL